MAGKRPTSRPLESVQTGPQSYINQDYHELSFFFVNFGECAAKSRNGQAEMQHYYFKDPDAYEMPQDVQIWARSWGHPSDF